MRNFQPHPSGRAATPPAPRRAVPWPSAPPPATCPNDASMKTMQQGTASAHRWHTRPPWSQGRRHAAGPLSSAQLLGPGWPRKRIHSLATAYSDVAIGGRCGTMRRSRGGAPDRSVRVPGTGTAPNNKIKLLCRHCRTESRGHKLENIVASGDGRIHRCNLAAHNTEKGYGAWWPLGAAGKG